MMPQERGRDMIPWPAPTVLGLCCGTLTGVQCHRPLQSWAEQLASRGKWARRKSRGAFLKAFPFSLYGSPFPFPKLFPLVEPSSGSVIGSRIEVVPLKCQARPWLPQVTMTPNPIYNLSSSILYGFLFLFLLPWDGCSTKKERVCCFFFLMNCGTNKEE